MKRDSDADRATLRRWGEQPVEARDTVTMGGGPPPISSESDKTLEPLRAYDRPETRYHVVERIGLGGMGEISATFDAKIGREIALKTLISRDPAQLPALEARFVREARVQALLEHPAIVPVYDIGIGPDMRPFFTMKRIRGETLASVIEKLRIGKRATQRRVGKHRLLSAFVTVCLAMDFAHQRGVVHRDLKPENIMLGPHGEVYILDWGLARGIPKASPDAAPAIGAIDSGTLPGEMVGTPGFMPPEQVIGQHEEVDARSDVYALGAILYEILTLHPLHDGDDVVAIVESTLNPTRTPPPPSDAAPELMAVAMRATRFHKEQRFASVRALADAIERFLDGDRDQELRSKLSAERLTVAKEQLRDAIGGSADQREKARAQALQNAGRALALMPESPEAASVVLELLAHPPEQVPLAVSEEFEALERSHRKTAMRDNALRITSWFLVAPFALASGIVRGWFVALILLVMGFASAYAMALWRRARTDPRSRLLLLSLTTALFVLMSGLFGPFLLIPAIAAVNTVLFSAQATPKERPLYAAIGLVPFILPMVLEMVGAVPASFDFVGSDIILHPRVIAFSPTLTFLFLAVISSLGIVTPTFLTGRLRDALTRAEHELVMQKWQLARLAPRAPKASPTPSTP